MTTMQTYTPPSRKRVFFWLVGVYGAVALACIVLAAVPLTLFGRDTFRAARDQQATAEARQGWFAYPRAGADDANVPPTLDLRPTEPAIAPITLPGSAAQQPAAGVPPCQLPGPLRLRMRQEATRPTPARATTRICSPASRRPSRTGGQARRSTP